MNLNRFATSFVISAIVICLLGNNWLQRAAQASSRLNVFPTAASNIERSPLQPSTPHLREKTSEPHSHLKPKPLSEIVSPFKQPIKLSRVSPQVSPGPFGKITFSPDTLRFVTTTGGNAFVAPVTAMINDVPFPVVKIKSAGRKLVLSGNPGGNPLESLFPDRGTVSILITNGDGEQSFYTLTRQGERASVLSPSISTTAPSHGSPLSSIVLSGSNFSPKPNQNIVTFTTPANQEIQLLPSEATTSSLAISLPLIPLETPNNFYAGLVGIRIQTAAGYSSSSAQLAIDPLPANPMPVGKVSEEFGKMNEALYAEIEHLFPKNLAEQGFNPEQIQALKDIPRAASYQFQTLVQAALKGQPQSFTIDINNDGTQETIVIDKPAIDLFERIITSGKIPAKISALTIKLNKQRESINQTNCQASQEELDILENAQAFQTFEAIQETLIEPLSYIVDALILVSFLPGGQAISLTLAAVAGVISVTTFFSTTVMFLIGIKPIALSRIDITPGESSITIGVGQKTTIGAKGVFISAIPVNSTGSVAIEILSKIIVNIILIRKSIPDNIKELFETVIERFLDLTVKLLPPTAQQILQNPISPTQKSVSLSSNTTSVQILGNSPAIQADVLCNGYLSITGQKETNNNKAEVKLTTRFPLTVSESSSTRSTFINVIAPVNKPPEVHFQMIAQGKFVMGTENQTLQILAQPGEKVRMNFVSQSTDPEGGFLTHLWTVDGLQQTTKDCTFELTKGSHSVSLTVTDTNGGRGTAFAGIVITETNSPPTPGFSMTAFGQTKYERETLQGVVPFGQPENVSFSAIRSFDPDGGLLRYDWQLDGSPVSSGRDFTSPVGSGIHTVQLTVTDNENLHSSVNGTVIVTTQEQNQPLLTGISPVLTLAGSFNLTINGRNFNPTNAEVLISGLGCESGCATSNSSLTVKTATQLVAPVQIINPGAFTVTVRNGFNGKPSNGLTLNVSKPTGSQALLSLSPTSLAFNPGIGETNLSKSLTISNSGSGILNWRTNVTTNNGGGWLNVFPTSGGTPTTTSVSTNITGLSGGTYTGQITITADGAGNSPQVVPVTLTISSGNQSPGPFTLSNETPVCNNTRPAVQLRWTPSLGANTYDLSRNGSLFVAGLSENSFFDRNLQAGFDYTYSVQARNPFGNTSSNAISVSIPSNVCSGGNFTPAITSVSPNPVPGLEGQQPFTVFGHNFGQGMNVTLRDLRTGQTFPDRPYTLVSATQLTLNPNFTNNSATWTVQIFNGGLASNAFSFTVTATAAAPSITSVSPNPVPGLEGQQPFTVFGHNFGQGMNVTLRDLRTGQTFPDRPYTLVSATQLTLNPNFTNNSATWTVQIFNGGLASNAFSFTVTATAAAPSITSVSPNPVPRLNGTQTLTITDRCINCLTFFGNRFHPLFSSVSISNPAP